MLLRVVSFYPLSIFCRPLSSRKQTLQHDQTHELHAHKHIRIHTSMHAYTRAHRVEDEAYHKRRKKASLSPSIFLFLQIYVWSVSLFFFVFLSASPLLSRNFLPLFQSRYTPPCTFGHRGRKKDVGRKLGEGKRGTRQAFRIPRALKPYFKSIQRTTR